MEAKTPSQSEHLTINSLSQENGTSQMLNTQCNYPLDTSYENGVYKLN